MEQNKIVVKSKVNKKAATKKEQLISPGKAGTSNNIENYGLNLVLDNSLSKFVNDPFIIEHTKTVDRKFANKPKA